MRANTATSGEATACDVLVLDDSFIARLGQVELLEDAGFRVVEAANSTQALAALQRTRFRVLLTDVKLGPDSPIRDGRTVAAEAMRLCPDLAVIYASGWSVDLGRPLAAHERVLLKPFSPGRLRHAVETLLRLQPAEPAAAALA
jgi:CheY-like chemotaxis protein